MIVSTSDAVYRKVHLYFQQNKRSYIESTLNITINFFRKCPEIKQVTINIQCINIKFRL